MNSTPYFVAEITDRDGINAAGAGVGHDMQLVIDGKTELTYTLNDNFQYDFGSYTTGTTYYCLPELAEGEHRLKFTAWDILNNPTTQELRFRVARGLKPTFIISCTDNPATTSTTFVIANARTGSNVDVNGLCLYRQLGPEARQRPAARHRSLPLSCTSFVRRSVAYVESQETDSSGQ